MNIFHKAALQGLLKSRTRTLVTIVGVILSEAMITGVVTFGVSLLDYMANGSIAKYGNWHVAILNASNDLVQEQQDNPEVADTATFENIGYAMLEGGKNPDKPYLFLAGFGDETYEKLPITLLSGRLPENSQEILISGNVAANGGVTYEVGDTLTLSVGNRMTDGKLLNQHNPYSMGEKFVSVKEKTYTVVGIYQRPCFEEYSAPGYTVITKAEEGAQVESTSLFITLQNPYRLHAYMNTIADGQDIIYNDNVLRFMGLSNDNLFNLLLYSVGGIVIAIIMIGSVFLIYNSFHISLSERTQQFGILLSVGATAKQLKNSVLFEGLCIGLVGIPVGILVGIGCIGIVISVVGKNFGNVLYTNVPFELSVSVPAILCAAIVSLITILISAYIPARKASHTPVMECIKQSNDVKIGTREMKTSRFIMDCCGLEGTLALKNFKRNKKRYRSIVLSLALSVILFIAASAFVADLQQAAESAVVFTTYDIGLATPDMDDEDMQKLYDQLKGIEGLSENSYQALLPYTCTIQTSMLSDDYWKAAENNTAKEKIEFPVDIQFLDDSSYLKIVEDLGLPTTEYMGEKAKLLTVAKVMNATAEEAADDVSELKNLFTQSDISFSVTPKTQEGEQPSYDVTATMVDYVLPDALPVAREKETMPYYFSIVAPYSLKKQLALEDAVALSKGLTFNSDTAAQTTDKVKAAIEGMGITSGYNLYNMHKMLDDSRNYIFIANVFAYTFIVMISLIAAANVFNTISTNIKLRRRELAMLRSVGMSDKDFQKMMNFECAFFGGKALLVGLPIAIFSSWLIYKGMVAGGAENLSFTLPWGSIGISIFSVLFIVFITMLYAISKIKKENIIEALRDDMT